MPESKGKRNDLEVAWIRELAGVLDETGLTEIEIEKADVRVRVSRAATASAMVAPPPAPAAAPQSGARPPAAADVTTPADAAPAGAVPSPMVGTIYLAPSPGADPFVRVGDTVSEGQTLMIVEAMKTMNPVAAPRGGKVKDILVRNEQPVEFGEPLLVLE